MPRPRRTRSRSRSATPNSQETPRDAAPRVLSRDEKRELILAHAAARKPLKPRDRMTLWGGVAVCVLFIVGAWAVTVQSGIERLSAQSTDSEIRDLLDTGRSLSADLQQATASDKTELQAGFQDIQGSIQLEVEKEQARETLRKMLKGETNEGATPPEPENLPAEEGVTSTEDAI